MMPSSSYIITCNLVQNTFAIPNNILFSFTIPNGVEFGGLISSDTDIIPSKVRPGQYSHIELQIYDQDFKPLQIIDDNMLITLSIKK